MKKPLNMVTVFEITDDINLQFMLSGSLDLNTNKNEPNNLKIFITGIKEELTSMVKNAGNSAHQLFSESSKFGSNFFKNKIKKLAAECKVEITSIEIIIAK